MYPSLVLVLALTGLSSATTYWAKNINYRSPSEHHPSLGVSIHKVVKRNNPQSPWDPVQLNFTHGVASGDPYSESVILWTRISPTSDNDQSNATVSGYVPLYNHETQQYVAVSKAPVCVEYTVAADEDLTDVVDSGTAYTSSDIDYTVKVSKLALSSGHDVRLFEVLFGVLSGTDAFAQVEAKNLEPYTTYYYQFTVCDSHNKSPLGRTKTTPAADDEVTEIGIAVYSCSNYREE